MKLEWTPPDRHKIQEHIAEVWGWRFYEDEYDDVRNWLIASYGGFSGVGFYEDVLEETNVIFMFDNEEQMTLWLMKWS
jgi:hypothetical protein